MMAALIDRKRLKADTKSMLAGASVSPKAMVALYLAIALALDLLTTFVGEAGLVATFLSILTSLLLVVLNAGFVLYCMDIRAGSRSGLLTLFDGFSLVGKLIGLQLVIYVFTFLWSMLFVIPGIIAAYRYRFASYNLLENPDLGIFEALNMSKQQTRGYKFQLFSLHLTYIGWDILAGLPALIYSSYIQFSTFKTLLPYNVDIQIDQFAAPEFMPLWGWVLITGLWHLVVALFYIPVYQCVELGYFEIAKQTSGVGTAQQPSHSDDCDHTDSFL